ncbi:Putative fibronectin type III [Septoria linicola]|uniref:Fibronectin type III n=1 Tax=Septoria linicola TaxID=215465 RepID=A0A9Q9AT62_9PEZI|nr:Putative fibronectin type III [Septoria linicola]
MTIRTIPQDLIHYSHSIHRVNTEEFDLVWQESTLQWTLQYLALDPATSIKDLLQHVDQQRLTTSLSSIYPPTTLQATQKAHNPAHPSSSPSKTTPTSTPPPPQPPHPSAPAQHPAPTSSSSHLHPQPTHSSKHASTAQFRRSIGHPTTKATTKETSSLRKL